MTAGDRRGSLWSGKDYQEFVTALRTSMSEQEIADHLGRTVDGIRSRAKLLLLGSYTGAVALRKLREIIVADPDYDWEAMARQAHAHARIPYWDTAADERLILTWARNPAPSMFQLTGEFGVAERDIARRCIVLGLATSYIEVADQFAPVAGSQFDTQVRLARAAAETAVGILTITSGDGAVLHQSLHADIAAAASACTELDPAELPAQPRIWTVTSRVVGEGPERQTLTGAWTERHTIDVPPADDAPERTTWWHRLLRSRIR
ncbi:hypothetical protein ACQP0C_00660 [Nocardia sp. CA-129566]|uniref:hypothetical protein n=1 Tax=Nocardia sp. CA-129566 TaxID=3239976 RepID=UPI003D96334F